MTTIDASVFFQALGKSVSAPSTQAVFESVGVSFKDELELLDGDYRTYIERPYSGVSFIFTDEAFFLGQAERAIGQGTLYFTGIFFYSDGYDGYSGYANQLPFGLRFSDAPSDAEEKLGPAEWERRDTNGALRARRWVLPDGRRLHLTFEDESAISIICFSVPDAAL